MPTYAEETFLGSGELYIDVFSAAGAKTGELDVGDCSIFAINAPSMEKVEKVGYRQDNFAVTTKSVTIKADQELKFTIGDINRENLKLAMMGTDSAYTQAASSDTDVALTAIHDRWVKIANRKLDPANPPVITNSGATVTYVEDTDYEVDYTVGRIYFLSAGAITDGQALLIDSTWLAITDGYKVFSLSTTKIEAFLRLVGYDQANDRKYEVIVHKAEIAPDGDINWLAQEFANISFTGKILAVADGKWDFYYYD